MKFHEALRRAVRQFGINVLQEHRLMSVLADYKAFEDYPAVKEVMKAVSAEGHGKELCRLAMDGSDEECLRYAEDLKKSLVFSAKRWKRRICRFSPMDMTFSGMTSATVRSLPGYLQPMRASTSAGALSATTVAMSLTNGTRWPRS